MAMLVWMDAADGVEEIVQVGGKEIAIMRMAVTVLTVMILMSVMMMAAVHGNTP